MRFRSYLCTCEIFLQTESWDLWRFSEAGKWTDEIYFSSSSLLTFIFHLKVFLISLLLFAILVYSLWRKVLECFSLTYPLFDVIKAMWCFILFKLEKSTVENNHPYWEGGVLLEVFLRCSSTETFLWQPIFAVMLWKICTYYLNSCGRNREFAVSFSSRKEMSTDEV